MSAPTGLQELIGLGVQQHLLPTSGAYHTTTFHPIAKQHTRLLVLAAIDKDGAE